jgi:multimeric flavodoxin WrbA
MNIIGFSSGTISRESNTDLLVKAVMEKSDLSSKFVKLSNLNFNGCRGCVDICAKPQVCRYDDDVKSYYAKIKEADAVVIGAPVYFGKVNATMMSFLERFFGYRHVSCAISGKPFVVVMSGGMANDTARQEITGFLENFDVNVLDVVQYVSSIPPCFTCGRHKVCRIGGLYKMMGESALSINITPEMFGSWESNPEISAALDTAAEKIRNIVS